MKKASPPSTARGKKSPKIRTSSKKSVRRTSQSEDSKEHGVEGSRLKLVPELTIPSDAPAGENYEIFNLKYSHDGSFLASACSDGSIRIYHASNGNPVTSLPVNKARELQYMSVRWRPNDGSSTSNMLLTTNVDGSIEHWHVNSKKRIHLIQDSCEVYCSDFNSEGTSFATGGSDSCVKVWDEQRRENTHILAASRGYEFKGEEQPGHGNRIFSVRFHPDDSNVLVSGSWDRNVQIWDLRSGRAERTIYGPLLSGDALDVKGNQILTGAFRSENPLELWDYSTGKLIEQITWFSSARECCKLYTAKFSPGTANLQLIAAAGCGSNEARVFDQNANNDRVGKLDTPKGIYSLDFQPNGRRVSFGGEDGSIMIIGVAKKSRR